MSNIGSAGDVASALQAAQAQQMASRARDKERAAGDSARRFQDIVDLRVAGTESAEAIRPVNDQDHHEPNRRRPDQRDEPEESDAAAQGEDDEDDDRRHIDVRA